MAFRAIFTKRQLRSTFSSSHLTFSTKTKPKTIPILWDYRTDSTYPASSSTQEIQLLSWGRGAAGQLGGGIEEIRIYPSSVASILVPPSKFALSSPIPGLLETKRDDEEEKVVKIGISCGLFHSGLLVDGKLWIWGKGDGGRLGLGHENPVFVPTLNENLMENVISSVSFGGMHSVALDSAGQLSGAMVVLVLLGMKCIHVSCIPDWLKVLGAQKFAISQLVGCILLQSPNQ